MHLGSFDAPDQFTPTYENWAIRREGWLPAFGVAKSYDREGTGRAHPGWQMVASERPE